MALAFAIALGAATPAAASASAAATPSVYVAMGDSVTRCCSGTGQQYPERFFQVLERNGVADTLHNLGVSGETSSSILGSQLSSALALIGDPATDTRVVTLDIGGNDVLGSASCNASSPSSSLPACAPTLQTFAANLGQLLDAITAALQADPGEEQLIVLGYYNPSSGRAGEEAEAAKIALILLGDDGRVDCGGQRTALGLNDLLACIGRDHGAAFADLFPSFLGKGATWFADSVHPNDAGISAIAGVLATTAGLPGVALPPTLGLPATVIADATTRRGAIVRYRVTVSDPTDPHSRLTCTPSSGAWFPIGTTMVRCRATNATGADTTGAFAVAVRGAAPQLRELIARVGSASLPRRERATLTASLERVRAELARGKRKRARTTLARFVTTVRHAAKRRPALRDLVSRARRITAVLR